MTDNIVLIHSIIPTYDTHWLLATTVHVVEILKKTKNTLYHVWSKELINCLINDNLQNFISYFDTIVIFHFLIFL